MKIERLPLAKHGDERGMLVQNDYPDIFAQVNHWLISHTKPGIVRGNHYHKRKKEWFYIIQGTMRLYVKNISTNEQVEVDISDKEPELVVMEPGYAHAFRNIGENDLIFMGLVNEAFNPEKPDTYPYEVIT